MSFVTLTAYVRLLTGYGQYTPIPPETVAKLFNGQFGGLQVIVFPQDASAIVIVRATGEAYEVVVTNTR